jgi:hypothetical protein
MRIETEIRFTDRFAVKPLLADSGLVARNQQNCFSFRIECESQPPNTVLHSESQLLHVWVSHSAYPSEDDRDLGRTAAASDLAPDFSLHSARRRRKLRFKLITDFDNPLHYWNMPLTVYPLKRDWTSQAITTQS